MPPFQGLSPQRGVKRTDRGDKQAPGKACPRSSTGGGAVDAWNPLWGGRSRGAAGVGIRVEPGGSFRADGRREERRMLMISDLKTQAHLKGSPIVHILCSQRGDDKGALQLLWRLVAAMHSSWHAIFLSICLSCLAV